MHIRQLLPTPTEYAQGQYRYGTPKTQSDFAKRYVDQGVAQGVAKGRAEGEAKGRADAIIAVLGARGIVVYVNVRAA